jgi:hypothetical protein
MAYGLVTVAEDGEFPGEGVAERPGQGLAGSNLAQPDGTRDHDQPSKGVWVAHCRLGRRTCAKGMCDYHRPEAHRSGQGQQPVGLGGAAVVPCRVAERPTHRRHVEGDGAVAFCGKRRLGRSPHPGPANRPMDQEQRRTSGRAQFLDIDRAKVGFDDPPLFRQLFRQQPGLTDCRCQTQPKKQDQRQADQDDDKGDRCTHADWLTARAAPGNRNKRAGHRARQGPTGRWAFRITRRRGAT